MKVLLISTPFLPVSPDLKYGGTERIVYLLESNLYQKKICIGVVATAASKTRNRLLPTIQSNIGVASVLDRSAKSEMEGLNLRFEHISQALRYCKLLKPDIVHMHDDNLLVFDHLIDAPTLLTLHSDIDGFWNPKLNPSIKEGKTHLVSISQSQKRIYESYGHKIDYVVYNGVDEDLYQIATERKDYLLSLGGIMPVKGQKDAIVVAKKSRLDLIIAGNIGDKSYFKKEIEPEITHDLSNSKNKYADYLKLRANSTAKIIYVGPVNDREKKDLYPHAKAFLMPIKWEEPFGLVMIEAMLSGTPVIAYKRGSVPELVKDGETGFIVKDLPGMVKATAQTSKIDPENCRKIAISLFGKKNMIDNYINVYKDIIQREKQR